MSESSKAALESMVEAQEKVFQAWKEAVEEYNNTKVLEMFGEDTRYAWQNCLDMQEKVFSLWRETVMQFQPSMGQFVSGDLVLQNWKRWWDLQEKWGQAWRNNATNSSNSWEVFNLRNWMFPDNMLRLYQKWIKVMQETFDYNLSNNQNLKVVKTDKRKDN